MSRKHNAQNLSLHHRKNRSHGGSDSPANTILLPRHIHRSWHNLFDNKEAKEIAEIINNKLLDPAYYFVCMKK